jgi:hypothetical protein
MRMHGGISINGRQYVAGDEVSPLTVYPFFLVHMAGFGGSSILFAYAPPSDMWADPAFAGAMYLWGILAIVVYLVFYLTIFGRDEVEWMFINAGLGLFGIVSQLDWLLSLFGKGVGDYPIYVHVIPVLYFVLYTFLIRHAFLDLFGAREDEARRNRVQYGYVAATLAFYLVAHFLEG